MNSISDQKRDNRDFVIFGRTIGEILDNDLVLTTINVETGDLVWVTRAQRDGLKRMWEEAAPKLRDSKIGIPILYGTGGEIPQDNLEQLFFNPSNYGIVETREEESKKNRRFIPCWSNSKGDKDEQGVSREEDDIPNR